jgi:FAD-dependent urate hydroxylase
MTLEDLEDRVRFDLSCVAYPDREWLPSGREAAGVVDALIVGGGQTGISIALALLRSRVTNIRILERNAPGAEGPWTTYARMKTLRTPKMVTGPEFGIPSLSVRAWYEARRGADAWRTLGKIAVEDWHEYLTWLRQVAGITVEHDLEVVDIQPLEGGLLAVRYIGAGEATPRRLLARNLVLATGIEGCGAWQIPEIISANLPRRFYRHTSEPIDFERLRGKRVGVLGAGASAFDNAACALEAGAREVTMYVRRTTLPTVNPYRWMEFAGFQSHFADLDDEQKWRFMRRILAMNQPPPQESFHRCARHPTFFLRLGEAIADAAATQDHVRLVTTTGASELDFLIIATGFVVDLKRRPELRNVESAIARWKDVFSPPADEADEVLGDYPYLGRNLEFVARAGTNAGYLSNVFSSTFGAMPSAGSSAGISSLRPTVQRIAFGVTRNLFLADAEAFWASLLSYDEQELTDTRLASASAE